MKTGKNGQRIRAISTNWRQKADSLHASLIENLTVAAFVLNSNHEVVVWNKACEELTGLKSADMVGTRDQWKPFYQEKRPFFVEGSNIFDFGFGGSNNFWGFNWGNPD
nr:PAS domain-containing protein [Nitrospiraceae bacterium]